MDRLKTNRPRKTFPAALLVLALGAAAMACSTLLPGAGETQSTQGPIPATRYPPATPYAQSPAAGICASPEGVEVEMSLLPGIPDPRCLEIRPDQRLTVRNRTGGPVHVQLGPFSADLADGEDFTMDVPLGEFLAPGVHALQVEPCCGGELVLPPP